jgi:hypothetical protein
MASQVEIWRGPIGGREQAVRISKIAAWSFGGVAVLLLGPMLVDMTRPDHPTVVGDFAIIMLLAIPAAIMLTRPSRGAAAILLAAAVVFLIASVAFVAFGAVHHGADALLSLPLSLAWAGLCWLAWRALKAAQALHHLDLAEAGAS